MGGPEGRVTGPGPWASPNFKTELVRSDPTRIHVPHDVRNFRTKMGSMGFLPISYRKGAPWTGISNSYVWVTQKKETLFSSHGPKGVPGGLGNS